MASGVDYARSGLYHHRAVDILLVYFGEMFQKYTDVHLENLQ